MTYFIIHSGADWQEQVEPLINEWSQRFDGARFIVLNGNQKDWIGDATAKIRQAEKIIYVVGKTSAQSENIEKEISIAIREHKTFYVYKLDASYAVNASLGHYLDNKTAAPGEAEGEIIFGKGRRFVTIVDKTSIGGMIESDVKDAMKYLRAKHFSDRATLMEQYKIFVQSSEDLVKRKQSVNSFYVTLNSVLLGAIVSILCAVNDLPVLFGIIKVSFLISVFTAIIGFVICFSWLSLLNSYADLNSSKMKIISSLERDLAVNLYETEWEVMTQKVGKRKYRSFSKKEKTVAILFGVLYALIMVFGLVLAFA